MVLEKKEKCLISVVKKNLPILIIAAGLVLIGYGVWKVMDTSKKTEQTLEAAKLAIEHPQKADRDRFKPKFGEAAGILEIPKSTQSFRLWRERMPMIWKKESGTIKAATIQMIMDKLFCRAIGIQSFGERVN